MPKLRVGVIGAGVMGERHCRIFASMPDITFVGVHDTARERALPVARRYDSQYFSVLDDLLAQVDAVSIATSTPSHAAIACTALDRGVHVLIEKPLAHTREAAEQIVAAAERSGCIVQVGHIERFNPTYTELHNVLADMQPLAIVMRRLSPFMTSAKDVDVVYDLMIHDLDLAIALGGGWPEQVTAVGRTLHDSGVDHAVATLSFASGPMVTLMASRITEQKVRDIAVVAGSAYIEADLLGKAIAIHHRTIPEFLQGPASVKYRQESLMERIVVPAAEPLQLELSHFIACVRDSRPPLVGVNEGFQALILAQQIKLLLESPATVPVDSLAPLRREPALESV